MKILVVEDDINIARLLLDYFAIRGHQADWATSAGQALQRLEESVFDVLVLDRGLPRMEGLSLLRLLRQEMNIVIPVLILTARDSEADKLDGFAAGADDYVVKPFSLAEVEARLYALLRRVQQQVPTTFIHGGGLSFDQYRHSLRIQGEEYVASPQVLKLLLALMSEPGRLLAYQVIEQLLWGDIQDSSDKLRQVIRQLRKLLATPKTHCQLLTVHGIGIRLESIL